jgi:hypothetical protein
MRPYLAGALELAATLYEHSGRPQEAEKSRGEAARLRDLIGSASVGSVAQV